MDSNSLPPKPNENQKNVDHSYDFIVDQQQQNTPPNQPKKKRLILIVAIIVGLVLIIWLLWMVAANSDDTSEQATVETQGTTADQLTTLLAFEDPRFQMDVPGIWLVSEDYEPGNTPVFFSGPATHELDEFDDNSETITMTVQEFASTVYPDEESDSSGEVVEQDDYENKDVNYTYRVSEVAIGASEEGGPRQTVAKNVARQGDRVLVAEVAVPAEVWDHYRELINQSMRSLELR